MSIARKSLVVLLLLGAALVALNSIAFAQTPEATPEATSSGTIKMAVMGPFTGDAASIGNEQLDWVKLAVEDFNKSSGMNVQLVQSDTQLDAAKAVTAAQSIIADPDIYGVVGPSGSQEVDATGKLFAAANLVIVSPSATRTSLTQSGYSTFFRTVPTDAAQGPTDGNFIWSQGVTKLFIIDDQTSYATGLADAVTTTFTADGGTVVDHESVTQQDQDFSALATKIGASGAQAVFFPGQIASQGALLAKQLQEQGITVKFFAGDGFQSVSDFITGAAGATDGAFVSAFAPDIHNLASSADVVQRYTAEYGQFGTFGPPAYTAAQVVLEAIQRAQAAGNLTRAAVVAEVAKTNIPLTVMGVPLSFDKNGDISNNVFYMFTVKDGNFVPVALPGAATPEATESMTATAEATMSMTPEATASS